MAEAPDELDALKRAAYGRSTPEVRAAAEARLAELERPQPIVPPHVSRPRFGLAIAAVATLLVLVAGGAGIVTWSADSRRVFDHAPIAEDANAPAFLTDFAPGGTIRWLGRFEGRNVYATLASDGTVCVGVPFAAGGTATCATAFEFTIRGIGLSSRTIEGDFAFVWGPSGDVQWGEFPH